MREASAPDARTEPGDPLAGQDDATLVARSRDGDVAAFEALVDRYQGPIFRHALRMLGDRAEAEDVTQDSLVATWRRLDQLNEPAHFRAWLYRGATHRCLDQLRQRARTPAPESLDAPDPAGRTLLDAEAADGPGPEGAAVHGAQWQALAVLVRELPPNQRACWILRELDGFGYAEIARIVRTTEGGVRGQLARARASLAKGMAEWR